MITRWPRIGITMLCWLIVGCMGTTEVGHSYYVNRNAKGQEVLSPGACGNAVDPCNEEMRSATVTNNPADEEFWQFEARPKNTLYFGPFGLPIIPVPGGRIPKDFNVIGPQTTCEAVRARVTDPTEPCKGPFYFHRQPE